MALNALMITLSLQKRLLKGTDCYSCLVDPKYWAYQTVKCSGILERMGQMGVFSVHTVDHILLKQNNRQSSYC